MDEFYSCTLCQSFAPNHVCIISPERLGLCGAYNWLDCKASFNINPTGPNQPIKLGKVLDPSKGYWEGTNDYAKVGSHGVVDEVAMYSIMENPMTACGCFECIVMLIPEANGVMVVSREDTSMTPAGMTFSTLAGLAGGGIQTPGVMGVGKFYLASPKFISADGGFRRVVWMSSFLKDSMAEELKAVAEREGDPVLIDRIADERSVSTVEELLAWLGGTRTSGPRDGADLLIGRTGPERDRTSRRPSCRLRSPRTTGRVRSRSSRWERRRRMVGREPRPSRSGARRTLPFLHFEETPPHRPVIALEIASLRPNDWSAVLLEAWGEVRRGPRQLGGGRRMAGADLIVLVLGLEDAGGDPVSPDLAVRSVTKVLESTGLPVDRGGTGAGGGRQRAPRPGRRRHQG